MGGDEKKLLRLWREKRGEAEPEDLSDILAVQMGSFTEPLNVAWFEKNTGYRVKSRGIVLARGIRNGHPMRARSTASARLRRAGRLACSRRSTAARARPTRRYSRATSRSSRTTASALAERAFLSAFKGNGDWVMFEYALDDDYAARLIAAEARFGNASAPASRRARSSRADAQAGRRGRI
jgi:hypothetical protein